MNFDVHTFHYLPDRLKASKVQKSTFNLSLLPFLSSSLVSNSRPTLDTNVLHVFALGVRKIRAETLPSYRHGDRRQGAISEILFNLLTFTKKHPLPSFVGTSSPKFGISLVEIGGGWNARMRLAGMIVVWMMPRDWNLFPWNWVYGYGIVNRGFFKDWFEASGILSLNVMISSIRYWFDF